MKRFLIPLLAAIALPTSVEANWFGKYGSEYEAREACFGWQRGGFKFQYENKFRGKFDDYSRSCYREDETKQYLGFEKQNVKRGKTYQGYPNKVVKKRYKF